MKRLAKTQAQVKQEITAKVISFPCQSYAPNTGQEFFDSREVGTRSHDYNGCAYFSLGDNRLIDAGIYKDDHLLVDLFQAVGTGDLVIICDNSNKVHCGFAKFLGGGKVRLNQANKDFTPLVYDLSEVKIIGKAIKVERDL